jgi:hypothetical protein
MQAEVRAQLRDSDGALTKLISNLQYPDSPARTELTGHRFHDCID